MRWNNVRLNRYLVFLAEEGCEMAGRIMPRSGRDGSLIAGLLGALLLSFSGCASEPPKPAPTVTPDQVRSHADKAFEKLKQEEQNRAVDPAMTP